MFAFYLSALDSDEERDRLSELYEQNHQLLTKVALKLVRTQELAEDAVHETFLKAIEDPNKIVLQTSVNFRNWSVTVVRSKCYDILRRQQKFDDSVHADNDFDVFEIPADEPTPEWNVIRRDSQAELQKCLAELEPLNRQILEMKYVHEMSFKQICSELNLTFAQVNGRLARTRAKVSAMLKKEW